MSRPYDVMAAGHLCFDVIPRFPDTGATHLGEILRPGKLVEMLEAKLSTGGPVSNTGINLQILGMNVSFCARVGDDEFGGLTRRYLEKRGNPEGIRKVEGQASSYTVALSPPNIDRIFLHNPGTNHTFGPEDLKPELIAQCKHFHLGYPPLMRQMYAGEGAGLAEVFRIAKEAGATTSCDMSLPDPSSEGGQAPWRKILERTLPHVDIFLPSIEEAFYMLEPEAFLKMKKEHQDAELIDFLNPEDYTRLADLLLGMGSKMTSLKSGHRGWYLKTQDQSAFEGLGANKPGDAANWSGRELWCPAYHAPNLASATGSGDSSIAGFLTAFTRGEAIERALKYANCVGWQNVQELDAISGIHDWDYTTDLIAKKMPMNDVHISSPGWAWSEEFELWAAPGDPLAKA